MVKSINDAGRLTRNIELSSCQETTDMEGKGETKATIRYPLGGQFSIAMLNYHRVLRCEEGFHGDFMCSTEISWRRNIFFIGFKGNIHENICE